jgi:hypothetical protein
MNIESFKRQIGLDIVRTNILINNIPFTVNTNDSDPNYELVTDKFNFKLMNVISQFQVIDLDLINKIDIIMCQNLFNFITQIFSLLTMHKIDPEQSIEYKAEKSISIVLNKNEQYVSVNFKSLLIISYDKILDPEFSCGTINFNLILDLKRNTFRLPKFKLFYDVDKCNPNLNNGEQMQLPGLDTNTNINNNKGANMLQYIVPAGLSSAIIATPFILGALGGKHRKKIQKIKFKKNRKTKRLKTRK